MKNSITSIILPLIAGLLHFNVFFQSLFKFIAVSLEDYDDNELLLQMAYNLEKSVVFAYIFDLVCIYCFNVVPFSRCSKGAEIAMHHFPILTLIIPLGIPLHQKMTKIDPTFHEIFGTVGSVGVDNAMRLQMINALLKALGLGFMSSLNEFIMCLQRSEMNVLGITAFQNIAYYKGRQIMTSRLVIGLELYFKLVIFWIFPLISCFVYSRVDKIFYDYHMGKNPNSNILNIFMSLCSSVTLLRLLVHRMFMFCLYPKMGLRTFKKIMTFHEEGAKKAQ